MSDLIRMPRIALWEDGEVWVQTQSHLGEIRFRMSTSKLFILSKEFYARPFGLLLSNSSLVLVPISSIKT